MAMALEDAVGAVCGAGKTVRGKVAGLRPEPHGSAEIRIFAALFGHAGTVAPFGNQRDHRLRRIGLELRRMRTREPRHVAGELDHRDLQAQADAQVRDLFLPSQPHGGDLAFDAPFAEPPGHEDGVDGVQPGRALRFYLFGVHVADVDPRARTDARMQERFGERDIGVPEIDVLADHGDLHLGFGVGMGIDHRLPLGQARGRHIEAQLLHDNFIELLRFEHQRNLVQIVHVHGRDHGALFDVGEERDLGALLIRQWPLRAAHENIRLDTD